MLRIPCPYCGVQDFTEFVYGGDASTRFPDLADTDIDRWTEFVMFRDNPRAMHKEYWQHRSGCGQWLRVERHTVSHEIQSVTPARDVAWPDAAQARQAGKADVAGTEGAAGEASTAGAASTEGTAGTVGTAGK